MRVLENKARTVAAALVAAGHICETQEMMVFSIVLTQLLKGGNYVLIEDRNCIHVRNQSCDIGVPCL